MLAARSLNPDLQARITHSLCVRLSAELHHSDSDPHPPGVTDYFGSFTVTLTEDDIEEADPRDGKILRHLTRGAAPDDGIITIAVGHAQLALGELIYPELFDAFDARSADYALIAGVILDRATGELSAELMKQIEGLGIDVLAVDHVEVEKEWRGLNIGLLGTGLCLRHLSRSAAVVALYPMAPGSEGQEARDASARALGEYWSTLGFRHFRDGVWILDPALEGLQASVAALQE